MTAFEDIIAWAGEKLRPWQQDALRRVVDHDRLTEQDTVELAQLCRNERAIRFAADIDLTPQPLSAQSVGNAKVRHKVTLLAISEIKNLNKLSSATPLAFGATGLTVIYGDNGSGKTGYSRILNVLCRARNVATIHRNVFSTDGAEPSAKLSYEVDGTVAHATWTRGAAIPPELRNVSVFDSDCASIYVEKDHEVAYAPFGLDLLDRLARAYLGVQNVLKSERQRLQNAAPRWPEAFQGTTIQPLLEHLLEPSSVDALRTRAHMTAEEQEAHRELRRLVSDLQARNPEQKVAGLQSLSRRLTHSAELLEKITEVLGDDPLTRLKIAKEVRDASAEAVRLAATDLFQDEPLAGIGESAWRQLWEAAKRFSEKHAYVDRDFPVTSEGARCPLCLQELTQDGRDRFKRFEDHIRQDLAKTARTAQATFTALEESVTSLVTQPTQAGELVTEVNAHDPDMAKAIQDAFAAAERRRAAAMVAIKDSSWDHVAALAYSDTTNMRTLATGLFNEAERLKEQISRGELPKHEAALKELDARACLETELPAIEREVLRLQELGQLQIAIEKDTDTTQLSKKSTALTKEYVTDALTSQFARELKELSADELAVVLEKKRSQHGITSHHVKLQGANFSAPVGEIASEGEQSAIALAAFLAEIQQTPADAGIVLDDPVTSMDHLRRDRVAARLVAEAAKRQVIVFTHEIVFLMELVQISEVKAIPLKVQTVVSWASTTGMPERDLPWIAMPVGKRVGFLNSRHQEARARYEKGKAEYESFAKETYGFLREAWERGVEELVLNGVVRRFTKEVQTKRLNKVVQDLRPDDFTVVENAMSRCSEFFRGHDEPPSVGKRIPSPQDLQDDIGNLEAWVTEMRKRRV